MKKDYVKKQFLSLLKISSVAICGDQILQVLNSIIVGNIVGENGLAAVNVVFPIYMLATFIAGIIGIGTKFLFCIDISNFNQKSANKHFGEGIIFSVFAGIIMLVIMTLFKSVILDFLGITGDIRIEAEQYWIPMQLSVGLLPLNYLLGEIVYVEGDKKICLISSTAIIVFNVLFSVIFCNLTKSTAGSGYGSFLATIISISILICHFFRKCNTLKFEWHFSFSDIILMFRLAFVESSKYLDISLLTLVLEKIVTAMFSVSMLPVLSVAIQFIGIASLFCGAGDALMPIGEVYLWERNFSREKYAVKYALKVSIIISAVVAAVLFGISPFAANIFGVTTDGLKRLCTVVTCIVAVSMPFRALSSVFISQYMLLRKIWIASAFEWARGLIVPAALAFCLSFTGSITGIIIGLNISEIAVLLIFGTYVRLKYGKNEFPFMLEKDPSPIFNMSDVLTESNIVRISEASETFLREKGANGKEAITVALLLEESMMLTLNKNEGKRIFSECSVFLYSQEICVMIRDTGVEYNIVDADSGITGLGSYIVATFMEQMQKQRNIRTLGGNRYSFSIKRNI